MHKSAEKNASANVLLRNLFFISGAKGLTRIRLQPAIYFCLYRGTIATYDPGSDHFMFRPLPKAAPVRYYQTKDTVIVDLQGRTANQSEIRPGIGATMYYTPSGDRMIVRKIVLGQPTTG